MNMYTLKLFTFLLATLALNFSLPSTVLSQSETIYAFTSVNVLPMDEENVLSDQTVIVRGDRITEMGPASQIDIPEGAVTIDGAGKFLMPGLAEMHGHIPSPRQPEQFTKNVLFLYLAGGVTTVRGMLGHPGQLELKENVNTGEIDGPTLYLAGPSFNGNSVNSPEQAVEKVKKQVQEGWDLLKIHPGLTVEEYDAMAKTAHELGISFGGHIPADVGLKHALEMGQETIDHLDGYIQFMDAADKPIDRAKMDEAIELSLESGVWVVPTMALWESIIGAGDLEKMQQYPELKYMPDDVVNRWKQYVQNSTPDSEEERKQAKQHAQNRLELLKALHDAGVPVIMGTDAPQVFSVPGFSIYREIKKMAESGMSNFEILRTGTETVGEYYRNKDTFGLVAEGHRADLLLIDGNPLENLDNLQYLSGVMARGIWYSEDSIHSRLQEIEHSR